MATCEFCGTRPEYAEGTAVCLTCREQHVRAQQGYTHSTSATYTNELGHYVWVATCYVVGQEVLVDNGACPACGAVLAGRR